GPDCHPRPEIVASVCGSYSDLIAIGIVELAVQEIISVMQLSDIVMADDAFGSFRKDRHLVAVAELDLIEHQVERNSHQCRRTDAGMKYGFKPGREVMIELRCGDGD